MNLRRLRQLIVPVVLCVAHALVPLPAAGQSGAGVDDPQQVAEALAEGLVSAMLRHPILGERVALQPLDPRRFSGLGLNKRVRQQLYDLLVVSLRSELRESYKLVDPSRFTDIARILEEQGESDWLDGYMELLRASDARINIVCTASASALSRDRFKMTCTAVTMKAPVETLGTGVGEFGMEWVKQPMAPDGALAWIAEDMVAYMQGVGGLEKVSSVDSKAKSETVLSAELAKRLLDKFNEKLREWPGWRAVGGAPVEAGHRAEVEVQRYKKKLDLRVELYSGSGGSSVTTFRESMYWTADLRELAGVPASGGGQPVPGTPEPPGPGGGCEAGADPGERKLPDQKGRKLKHWALLTEHRLNTGDYAYFLEVLVSAQTYLADHCNWDRVARILDVATAGLAEELGARIERDPDGGLEELLRVEASAGRHLALMRLRARAYEMLGVLEEQDRAYDEMLAIAPDDSAVLLPILQAQARIRAEIGAKDGELALGLAGPQRSLVRQGLASFGFDGGEGPGGFDASFREVLRSWQASQDDPATGYLTGEQAQALMNAGRAAEEREEDDAAFARARAVDTEASYTTYLTQYPDGRHASQARRLREAARVREAAAAAETALMLTSEQRVLIERGLASAGSGEGGAVDGEFDDAFRDALRSWQASQGDPATGYLTGEQAQALMLIAEVPEPGHRFRDCDGSWCPELVVVPAGEYRMGSPSGEAGRDDDEGPVHRVSIGEALAVGVYEVTFEEWDACVRDGGCWGYRPEDWGWGRGRRPVINVSWEEAQAYVSWLSRKTGEEYRLPSESEWEYVARAGTETAFHTGETISTEQANYNGNYVYGRGRQGWYRDQTVEVGSFGANGFGLYDVHGNVSEWVEDCWNGSYLGAPGDGSAWMRDCRWRVLRGGSWNNGPRKLRSAFRHWNTIFYRDSGVGFRIVRTL